MYFDTLYRNGKIYTMDDAVPKADWVATKGGKIAALGNGVHNLIEAARTIDLQGKVMFPGFIDSHMHGTPTGAYLGDFKVQAAASVQEVIDIVAEDLNSPTEIKGVLITKFKAKTKLGREVKAEVQKYFKENLYKTEIPENIRVAEAPGYNMPVVAYDPECTGTKAYLKLADEFLEREK